MRTTIVVVVILAVTTYLPTSGSVVAVPYYYANPSAFPPPWSGVPLGLQSHQQPAWPLSSYPPVGEPAKPASPNYGYIVGAGKVLKSPPPPSYGEYLEPSAPKNPKLPLSSYGYLEETPLKKQKLPPSYVLVEDPTIIRKKPKAPAAPPPGYAYYPTQPVEEVEEEVDVAYRLVPYYPKHRVVSIPAGRKTEYGGYIYVNEDEYPVEQTHSHKQKQLYKTALAYWKK